MLLGKLVATSERVVGERQEMNLTELTYNHEMPIVQADG